MTIHPSFLMVLVLLCQSVRSKYYIQKKKQVTFILHLYLLVKYCAPHLNARRPPSGRPLPTARCYQLSQQGFT